MALRYCLPGEFYVDAVVVNYSAVLGQWFKGTNVAGQTWATIQPPDDATVVRVRDSHPFVALRWVLNPSLGIPLTPFTVWRRPIATREAATPIPGWQPLGGGAYGWDGASEMIHIELDVAGGGVTAFGLSASGGMVASASSPGGATTLVLEGGPMLNVQLLGSGALSAARGISVMTMANGGGWTEVEIVGLPVDAGSMVGIYYQPSLQGPVGALTDPRTAAVQRLTKWGPPIGWMTLNGLPPWKAPDPNKLIAEYESNLLPALRKVMTDQPPPNLDQQYMDEVVFDLPRLARHWGGAFGLNGAGDNQTSKVRVRPLQSVASAVSSDAWASLALGFGTGVDLNPQNPAMSIDDFMVTAPWKGFLRIQEETPFPWPWPPWQQPIQVTIEFDRDLAGIVLAPKGRSWPAAPTSMAAQISFAEGAPKIDTKYHVATSILTDRTDVMPDLPRVSAFALARFDSPGTGAYEMRAHPLAGGEIPVATAQPVPNPQSTPDPNVPPNKVVLRDSGVPLPITGPAAQYQYVAAAGDLFGRWGPWSAAWLSALPANVLSPTVISVLVNPAAGPGNADPCQLAITADVQWDWRERSLHQMQIGVYVYDPPAPPTLIPAPPASPPPVIPWPSAVISFDAIGTPSTASPGVTVQAISDDGQTVYPGAHPAGTDIRRFRVKITGFSVTYGSAVEKAVAVYAQGQETVRPLEWSMWVAPREAAIAPNPIVPPTPPPLPAVYPFPASLPDPAGLSRATVTWTPSGATAYRVYEATEASLLAAGGRSGPVLTAGYAARMQALFDLYKVPANLEKLQAVYRKTDPEPVSPPPQPDGSMQYDVLLPRGSSLIHCFVVVALTPANLVSSWPVPDVNGRNGFLPFAIPHLRQPVMPQLTATLDASGTPQITVNAAGAIPATSIRLYRAANAFLARAIGSMQLVSVFSTTPATWQTTTLSDAAATPSWHRVQYRAVLIADDDPDRAGVAVPSPPSKAYALLVPPAPLPPPTLTPNVPGSTATVCLVRVDTAAERFTTDIGDHTISLVVSAPGTAQVRFSSSLADLLVFASVALLTASSEKIGYVQTGTSYTLYLRLDRALGQALAIVLDIADPLGRTAHASVSAPGVVPDPPPALGPLSLIRQGGVIYGEFTGNTPEPPDPSRPWNITLGFRRVFPPGPGQSHAFLVPSIPVIPSPAQMPQPVNPLQQFAIAQVNATNPREFLFWVRSTFALRVIVQLTTFDGQSTAVQKVSP